MHRSVVDPCFGCNFDVLIFEVDLRQVRLLGDEDGPFDEVLQFPDVAGIGQPAEVLHRFSRDFDRFQTVLPGLLPGKILHQQRNVFPSLAQCRHLHRDEVDPVKEVFPELSLLYHLRQVAVGRTDNPRIDLLRTAVAQRFERVVLQYAQQFHLADHVQVADLVQEDTSAVGQFETALAVVMRIGEGAFFVSEHLAFEQRQ